MISPGVRRQLPDVIRQCCFIRFLHAAKERFHDVVQCDNAGHAAIFIQNHRKIGLLFLHLPEQVICLHVFRHEERLVHALGDHVFQIRFLQPEIIPGVQNADHVFVVAANDGIEGMPVVVNDLFQFPALSAMFRETT